MVIDEDLSRGNEQNRSWLKMSRVHFEVNRQQGRTALLDKSSNGTYIKMAIILPTGYWYAPSAVIKDAWYCMV